MKSNNTVIVTDDVLAKAEAGITPEFLAWFDALTDEDIATQIAANPDAPAPTPAAGTHDGGGAEHHDGNSAPRRRSRSRGRRSPQ